MKTPDIEAVLKQVQASMTLEDQALDAEELSIIRDALKKGLSADETFALFDQLNARRDGRQRLIANL